MKTKKKHNKYIKSLYWKQRETIMLSRSNYNVIFYQYNILHRHYRRIKIISMPLTFRSFLLHISSLLILHLEECKKQVISVKVWRSKLILSTNIKFIFGKQQSFKMCFLIEANKNNGNYNFSTGVARDYRNTKPVSKLNCIYVLNLLDWIWCCRQ